MSKFLIIGLGNIGDEYAHTRHNIGFDIADYLADKLGFQFVLNRLAFVAAGKYKGKQIHIIKPTTYMNLSGKAVQYWINETQTELHNTLVIVDDLAFELGKLRLFGKGSDGGHNGLKSIQEHLKTSDYPRLRFGIGNNFSKGKQVDFVLGKWTADELKIIQEKIPICSDAIISFMFSGLQFTMNKYNK